MNHKNTLLIRKITSEYIDFMKKTSALIEETKRATVLALKKVLKLEDGDSILINEDGSLDIKTVCKNEEGIMPEDKKQNSDKLTLNGREVTSEEFDRQREAAENQKGTRLEEVSKGNFRLHLND
jgi:lipase chaperone LimK